MRRTLLIAIPCLSLALGACNGDKGDAVDDTGASTGGDGDGGEGGDGDGGEGSGGDGSSSDCPDEVPEDYRNIWDCAAESCDGTLIYRYGTGTSDDAGNITVNESWFLFSADAWCADTFVISGESSSIDPATFNCSECEENWEVSWTMNTGNQCGLAWGSLFIDDNSNVEGPFDGFLMFDTHSPLAGRNPDDAALVVAAPVSGSSYYPNPNWAEGTASPTSSADGPPHAYEYVSDPMCAGRQRVAPDGPQVIVLDPEDLAAAPLRPAGR